MSMIVWGVVKEGRVVPSSPLPEGSRVEIRVADQPPEASEELKAEFEAWDRASVTAFELVEGMSRQGEVHVTRCGPGLEPFLTL